MLLGTLGASVLGNGVMTWKGVMTWNSVVGAARGCNNMDDMDKSFQYNLHPLKN